jgi:hypothetical protein
MPYGLIIVVASIALVAYFDFVTEASWIAKIIVSGLFVFSFASCFGWIAVNSLIGLFLLVALSIFIIFYRACLQARSRK